MATLLWGMMKVGDVFWRLWDMLFPPVAPGLGPGALQAIEYTTAEAQKEAQKLTITFDKVVQKAHEEDVDPIAVLVHQVKKASFKRLIESGSVE